MRLPLWRRRRDEELEEEIRRHLEMAIRDRIERGENPEQAAAAARREFGNLGLIKEVTREMWGLAWLGQFGRDVRYGTRMLLKNRAFTVAAVLVMALGIGPNTAMFSILYGVFWGPTGNRNESRLVAIWSRPLDDSVKLRGDTDGMDRTRIHVSPRDYQEWKRRSKSFETFIAVFQRMAILNDDAGEPEHIQIQYYTPGWFTTLGYPIIMGRDFLPEDGIKGNHRVVIITNRFWRSRYGADPNIIGKRIRLEGEAYTVVGVTAPGYQDLRQEPLFPVLVVDSEKFPPDLRILGVGGLLKPGVSIEQARSEMEAISAALAREYPQSDAGWSVNIRQSRNSWLPKRTYQNLWLLMGAVALVLLIACANVATLLLARSGVRRKEVAVRAAIGAGRWRIFRQLLTENLILCLAGAAFGIVLGWLILKLLPALLPLNSSMPPDQITLSLPALLFTVLITLLSGLIFGGAPAWRATDVSLTESLKEGGGAGAGLAQHRLARTLVVLEFAITLTLMAAAGMTIRSLWQNTRLDPGARTDRILTFTLPLRDDRFTTPEQILAFYQEMTEKIEALPDVRRVAISNLPPLTEMWQEKFSIPSHPSPDASQREYDTTWRAVSSGFLETFGVRLTRGRNFSDQDRLNTESVVIVNETFARQYLSGQDPLKQELLLPAFARKFRIIGVYRDIHNANEFGRANTPELCLSFSQLPFTFPTLAVWTSREPGQLRNSIAALVHSMDRELPMANVRTMEGIVSSRLAFGRFEVAVYGSFAGLALLLAVVGIYGLMTLLVKQRSREIGLRMALGARQWDVVQMILKQGVTIAIAGLILGVGGAWLVTRLMQSTLYGAETPNLATLAIAGTALIGTALLACLIPAWRASNIQPMVVLKND
jgi:putative ABC transport system permease protein